MQQLDSHIVNVNLLEHSRMPPLHLCIKTSTLGIPGFMTHTVMCVTFVGILTVGVIQIIVLMQKNALSTYVLIRMSNIF